MIKLRNLEDPRANRLLKELDARYFQFVESLPSYLKSLALSEETIYGDQGEGRFMGPTTLNPLITCPPWLFWELFSQIDDESFLKIATGGMFISLNSVLLDHLVDGQASQPGLHALLQHAFYDFGVSFFRELFSNSSDFWSLFDRYTQEYLTSLGIEVQTQISRQTLSSEMFTESAGGKVAPMLITIAGLTQVSGQEDIQGAIASSFRCAYIAGQLHDDILDWRYDLEKGHLTYVLTQLMSEGYSWSSGLPSMSELERIVHQEKGDLLIYKMVLEWFDQAAGAVTNLNCPRWMEYLKEYRSIAGDHQRSCIASHLRHELRAVLSPTHGQNA